MKKYWVLALAGGTMAALSFEGGAVTTVGGFAFDDNAFVQQVIGSQGTFYNYNSTSPADSITGIQLSADLTDSGENPGAATYVFSGDSNAFVDLSFGSTSIFNGAGADLAFFFAGEPNSISLDIAGGSNQYSSVRVDGYGVLIGSTTWALSVALVNLDDFGMAGDVALGDFRVGMGLGGTASPANLSLVGGFHNEATTVVPVPAAVWLFGSGLLGLVGVARRRHRH